MLKAVEDGDPSALALCHSDAALQELKEHLPLDEALEKAWQITSLSSASFSVDPRDQTGGSRLLDNYTLIDVSMKNSQTNKFLVTLENGAWKLAFPCVEGLPTKITQNAPWAADIIAADLSDGRSIKYSCSILAWKITRQRYASWIGTPVGEKAIVVLHPSDNNNPKTQLALVWRAPLAESRYLRTWHIGNSDTSESYVSAPFDSLPQSNEINDFFSMLWNTWWTHRHHTTETRTELAESGVDAAIWRRLTSIPMSETDAARMRQFFVQEEGEQESEPDSLLRRERVR